DRASHQEAVARIRFCIAELSLGVVTGEVGVGKTVALRAAVSQLDQAAHHIVYLANPTVGIRGLYVTIVRALGAVPRGFKAELIAQAQDLLAAEEHERRRRPDPRRRARSGCRGAPTALGPPPRRARGSSRVVP